MTDIVDANTRSRMMAAIGGKNTKPELILRKLLHGLGFRFRLHSEKLSVDQIWCCQNIGWQYLFMVAFGIATRVADLRLPHLRIRCFGLRNSEKI